MRLSPASLTLERCKLKQLWTGAQTPKINRSQPEMVRFGSRFRDFQARHGGTVLNCRDKRISDHHGFRSARVTKKDLVSTSSPLTPKEGSAHASPQCSWAYGEAEHRACSREHVLETSAPVRAAGSRKREEEAGVSLYPSRVGPH